MSERRVWARQKPLWEGKHTEGMQEIEIKAQTKNEGKNKNEK
jgi:hypothetical protein